MAARCHLLEDIAVSHRIADRATIDQHRQFEAVTEGFIAIDIEVGRIFRGGKLLGLRISRGMTNLGHPPF